jgi:hypothetical protein
MIGSSVIKIAKQCVNFYATNENCLYRKHSRESLEIQLELMAREAENRTLSEPTCSPKGLHMGKIAWLT